MQVLHVISFLIERTGGQIKPYASSLIQYLQTLWQEAQEHNMLKCAILTTLVHLVQVRLHSKNDTQSLYVYIGLELEKNSVLKTLKRFMKNHKLL